MFYNDRNIVIKMVSSKQWEFSCKEIMMLTQEKRKQNLQKITVIKFPQLSAKENSMWEYVEELPFIHCLEFIFEHIYKRYLSPQYVNAIWKVSKITTFSPNRKHILCNLAHQEGNFSLKPKDYQPGEKFPRGMSRIYQRVRLRKANCNRS